MNKVHNWPLFQQARSAWKILILHGVRAPLKQRVYNALYITVSCAQGVFTRDKNKV